MDGKREGRKKKPAEVCERESRLSDQRVLHTIWTGVRVVKWIIQIWKSICDNMLARVMCQVLFLSEGLLENNRLVCYLDSNQLVPLSYLLCLSSPAVSWLPVTMTGYKSWGTSSSRPNRRRTLRTISTPTVSTSPGWVSYRSPAPTERCWATQTQKDILQNSLHWKLQ